jgi:hypothetical protein
MKGVKREVMGCSAAPLRVKNASFLVVPLQSGTYLAHYHTFLFGAPSTFAFGFSYLYLFT